MYRVYVCLRACVGACVHVNPTKIHGPPFTVRYDSCLQMTSEDDAQIVSSSSSVPEVHGSHRGVRMWLIYSPGDRAGRGEYCVCTYQFSHSSACVSVWRKGQPGRRCLIYSGSIPISWGAPEGVRTLFLSTFRYAEVYLTHTHTAHIHTQFYPCNY